MKQTKILVSCIMQKLCNAANARELDLPNIAFNRATSSTEG